MRKIILTFGAFAVALVATLIWALFQYRYIDNGKQPVVARKAPILHEFLGRVVYTTDTVIDRTPLERDCVLRGGVFNACGSSCPPESEVCAEVCAYTCELGKAAAITVSDQCAQALSFASYPSGKKYQGKIAAVDFSTYSEARQFYTVIRNGAGYGPNFAGHYTVVEWGCGTSCQDHAIIDAQTGKIIHYGLPSFYGLEYKLDSSLLIVNPAANLPENFEQTITSDYYILNDDALNFVCRLPGVSSPAPL